MVRQKATTNCLFGTRYYHAVKFIDIAAQEGLQQGRGLHHCIILSLSCFVEISEFNETRVDPDQMPHSAGRP